MLTSVPTAVNKATRAVVLRHPNSMPCTVWRKRITRVELNGNGQPSEMGGAPTLGGMGVLRSEDETDFEYDELGPGMCLFVGPFQPADVNDREDGLLQPQQQEAQVEAKEMGAFDVNVGDLVIIEMGLGVVLAYEAAGLTGSVNIPPYVTKVVLNPRDDLHSLDPFLPG